MVVGLTGGIGSGKSTVVNFFKQLDNNIAIYIADIEAKKLMNTSNEIKAKISNEFGNNAYKNGQLNNAYIAEIVFENKKELKKLNKIVHPEVAKHFLNFAFKHKNKEYILYENAILFENDITICDIIITITCPLEKKIERVMKRDKTTKGNVEKRIKNQWKDEKKILQSNYVISNMCLEETKKSVSEIHNILTKKRYYFNKKQ